MTPSAKVFVAHGHHAVASLSDERKWARVVQHLTLKTTCQRQ